MIYLLFAAILSGLLVRGYINLAKSRRIFDYANERSMHEAIIPRGGGIAFVLVAVFISYLWSSRLGLSPLYCLYIAMLILLIIGAIDDIYRVPGRDGLPALIRICAHVLSAGAVVWCYVSAGFLWQILVFLAIVWWINLTNFMDGIDGIAAGFAIVVHGFLAYWSYLDGDTAWVIFNASLVATLLGFMLFNWSPARVFMGDSGSTVLGLTIGISGLRDSDTIIDIIPFAILSLPFWLDATYTLCRRILRGEKFWQAHRNHFYQRIVVHKSNPNGLSVVVVTVIYIGFSFIFGLIASMIRV